MMKRYLLLFLLPFLAGTGAHAQRVALKENLLYTAARLTPNLALETRLGSRSTLDLLVGYNPWNLKGSVEDNRKLVHVLVEPEYRYWTCEAFNGHFFGVHLLFARFNIGGMNLSPLFERAFRYQGSGVGAGVSYGYHWAISTAWGLEFTLGAGVVRVDYDKYACAVCSEKIDKFAKAYIGPTRAGVSLVYILN
jgi:hypothetical protein